MSNTVEETALRLKEGPASEKLQAANTLGDAARRGENIAAARAALEIAITDADPVLRVRAARALALHLFHEEGVDAVGRFLTGEDDDVRHGAIQAVEASARDKADIGPLAPALERLLDKRKEVAGKGHMVGGLASYYLRAGLPGKASRLFRHWDERVRFGVAAVFREAAVDGIDISPCRAAILEALADKSGTVRRTAAEALGHFHASREEWREIDHLLTVKRHSTVRPTLVQLLYRYVTRFDIRCDIPWLLEAVNDQDRDIRRGVIVLLERMAEMGSDISSYVPQLQAALRDTDPQVRETAAHTLKTHELKSEPGKRCPWCLDCELGLGPGRDSGSLEAVTGIAERMDCCCGTLTQTIYKCNQCNRHFLSSCHDHTGFHSEQHTVEQISGKDVEQVVKEIGRCPDPENPECSCDVHKKFRKQEKPLVRGTRKYSRTID